MQKYSNGNRGQKLLWRDILFWLSSQFSVQSSASLITAKYATNNSTKSRGYSLLECIFDLRLNASMNYKYKYVTPFNRPICNSLYPEF